MNEISVTLPEHRLEEMRNDKEGYRKLIRRLNECWLKEQEQAPDNELREDGKRILNLFELFV